MRLFKIFPSGLNWKYILSEILLIFIGINLAIWFNNWNTSKRTRQAQEIALVKIKEEINNNQKELELVSGNIDFILNAFSDFNQFFQDKTTAVVASPAQLSSLQKQYPDFYKIKDSVQVDSTQFLYTGQTVVQLEIIELTEIAWETTRSINIMNEFDYECLYALESMYNLQRRTQREINKAANALQSGDLPEFQRILHFLRQLESQLREDYSRVLKEIAFCT